jgi:hypothetical protein
MRVAFAVILAVVGYYVYKWWLSTKSVYVPEPEYQPPSPTPPKPKDVPPPGPGITMYGSDDCPWCTKQKEYFKEKEKEYTFVDCAKGTCPDFVAGYPTLVVDGEVKIGYQEV